MRLLNALLIVLVANCFADDKADVDGPREGIEETKNDFQDASPIQLPNNQGTTTTPRTDDQDKSSEQRATYPSYPINLTSTHRDLGIIYGDEHPFTDIKDLSDEEYTPVDIDQVNTHWIYYDSRDPENNRTIDFGCEPLPFDKQIEKLPRYDQVFIITHGFNSEAAVHAGMRKPLLNTTEYNGRNISRVGVFFTDWSGGAAWARGWESFGDCGIHILCYYHQPAVTTGLVGRQLGLFVYSLTARYKKVPIKHVYLIGFSLGAQISHYASLWNAQLRTKYGNKAAKIGRITALDPAGPDFQPNPGSYIFRGDADFVDAFHTSPGNGSGHEVFFQRYGMSEAIGDVDIYLNLGAPQPQCFTALKVPLPISGCSHSFAHVMWTYALYHRNDKSLESVPCAWIQGLGGIEYPMPMPSGNRSILGLDAIKREARGVQCLFYMQPVDESLEAATRNLDAGLPPMPNMTTIQQAFMSGEIFNTKIKRERNKLPA